MRSGSGSAEPDRLVLASRSPRRRQILTDLGIAFEVVEPQVEELISGDPEVAVLENARRKARAGRELATGDGIVLGVDTDVAIDGRLVGKPADSGAAREHLEKLSGRSHEVLSGLVLLGTGLGSEVPVVKAGVARTEVTFRDLDPAMIDLYVASGEWRDRAGGYAIQGLGSILVDALQGDFSNVVGLPVALLLQLAPNLIEPRKNPKADI